MYDTHIQIVFDAQFFQTNENLFVSDFTFIIQFDKKKQICVWFLESTCDTSKTSVVHRYVYLKMYVIIMLCSMVQFQFLVWPFYVSKGWDKIVLNKPDIAAVQKRVNRKTSLPAFARTKWVL